jgi:hypothetical protein
VTDPNRTSVGDVPAPLVIDTQFGRVEVVADPSMRTGDAPKFVQAATGLHNPPCERFCGQCAGAKHERAAVVKYLREIASAW